MDPSSIMMQGQELVSSQACLHGCAKGMLSRLIKQSGSLFGV
jgi:hypothetical protein